jgi:hypothetical protein
MLSSKLWGTNLHPLVEAFTVGEDYALDRYEMNFLVTH